MAMFVPRSFSFRSPSPTTRKDSDPEKSAPKSQRKESRRRESSSKDAGWRGFGWRPESFHKLQGEGISEKQKRDGDEAKNTLSATPQSARKADEEEEGRISPSSQQHDSIPSRSTPVAVPSRSNSRRVQSRSPSHDAHSHGTVSPGRKSPQQQDGRPLPPSVAAVLASTSIPKKKAFPKPRSTPRKMSTQQLMDEWRINDMLEGSSTSSSPTMDFLLSPPNGQDYLSRSESFESVGEMGRSFSSESIPSLMEENSTLSWSMPSSPRAISQRKKKDKSFSLPSRSNQTLDHPLSPMASDDNFEEGDEEDPSIFHMDTTQTSHSPATTDVSAPEFRPAQEARRPSNLKSNLTASLNSLRNSIRNSLSNFSAPSLYTLPEDHLSRGLFSDKLFPYRAEMRPRPLDGPATPELRRYLNPSSYHFRSPGQELHLHTHGRVIEHVDFEAEEARATSPSIIDEPEPTHPERGTIIALKPVIRALSSPSCSPSKSAGNWMDGLAQGEGGAGLLEEHQQPQYRRELRENGEFLRVCVLEMNMRRAGKFSDGLGRARLWLPPRQEVFLSSGAELRGDRETQGGHEVPKRWVGISA